MNWTLEDIKKVKGSNKKPAKSVKATSTNDLTQLALRMFKMKGFKAWRQNNGGVYDAKIKGYRRNSSTPGISDVLGFHRQTGQFLACEIKTGKDTLSNEQIEFLNDVKLSGGIAIVVRSSEDLELFIKGENVSFIHKGNKR